MPSELDTLSWTLTSGYLFLEIAQQRRQHVFGDGGAGADDQHAADVAGHLAHGAFHFGVELKEAIGVFVHAVAGVGEADPVMGAVEQAGVEIFLQLANLEGHGGLGHVQRLGRLGKAEQTGHRMKHLKSAIRHRDIALLRDTCIENVYIIDRWLRDSLR